VPARRGEETSVLDASLEPWERLRRILEQGDAGTLVGFLDSLGPAETARAISRLEQEEQSRLLTLLDPADAAEVIEDVSPAQAVDLIEDLPPERAAAIVDELQSDRQADLLGELDDAEAHAILREMSPEGALDARRLLAHATDSAGGLMLTEYLAYRRDLRVRDVLDDLQRNREEYSDYHVQYVYVVDQGGELIGVLRMRDLIFPSLAARLDEVMIANPLRVGVAAGLEELAHFFDEHKLYGVPVVDERVRLVGIVLPEAVEEAIRNRSDRQFLGLSGIVGGEELRTMPLALRSRRRLSWLSINVVLNLVAASVIAFYQDTLSAAIALAVFLPIISDMSGCSGNQAVAVSIRELTLGLVRPHEIGRVVAKEAGVGLLNGLALGLLLGGVALLWKGSPTLGLVVGGALAANTLLAVCLGGLLPLVLRRLGLDPALVSGPALTTATDMCGFFLVLSFATALLPHLAGV
jgi:magnesium transporter